MLTSFTRTIFFYFVLLVVIRLLGKRQIGQMEPSEFVVTMLVANLASIPMEDPKLPLHSGLIPLGAVLLAELLLTRFSMRNVKFRRLLCGKPVILIENGRIIQKNLRRTHITLDELTGQLRLKDVLDLRTVQYAILETNGNLSVFLYPKDSPATAKDAGIHPKKQHLPVTVVGDGYLYRENFAAAGINDAWVRNFLERNDVELADIYLLTLDAAGKTVFLRKE
jgi:uncharacterized membrane protein YcaP (DUF421 family)